MSWCSSLFFQTSPNPHHQWGTVHEGRFQMGSWELIFSLLMGIGCIVEFPRGTVSYFAGGSSTISWGLFAACNAFIPPWGIAPIVLFVGLAINQDAFNVLETRHVPAAIIGFFPQTADWILSIWPDAPKVKPGLEGVWYPCHPHHPRHHEAGILHQA